MTRLPSPREYQLAVQNPQHAFGNDATLRDGQARTNALRLPVAASGGFAVTFDITSASGRWAVRCFHKNDNQNRRLPDRYHAIGQFIDRHPELDFMVPVRYQDDGIRVNGEPFPTVRMRWAEGVPLGTWLQRWAAEPNPDPINQVCNAIREAEQQLQSHGAAHGDLQHGNILVRPDHRIWLIDYDGMYLPELAHLGAIEQGHRNYQHPDRGQHYDAELDNFSAYGIRMSLAALARRPELWETYGKTGENILFQATDFTDPDSAPIFGELLRLGELTKHVERFQHACRAGYSQTITALAGTTTARSTRARTVATGLVVHAQTGTTDLLRQLEGETVTVFGTVAGTKVPFEGVALINLGVYQNAEFAIVGFGEVAKDLFDKYGRKARSDKLLSLEGTKVAVTGTIWLYESKHSDELTPQIELDHAGFLQILDKNQYEDLSNKANHRQAAGTEDVLEEPESQPPPRAPLPPTPTPSQQSRSPQDPWSNAQLHADLSHRYKPRTTPQQPTPVPPPTPPSSTTPTDNRPPPVPPQYRQEQLRPPKTGDTPPSPQRPPPREYIPPPPPTSLRPSRSARDIVWLLLLIAALILGVVIVHHYPSPRQQLPSPQQTTRTSG
ncbi:hypothetical protein [Nocardia macrotermitis]|uniref:Protein kinase domain-containing protein n=1 Tax=Nocardia macrotermitis TaxID=2585198 RepID=A0A7K0CYG6_9NOCA|nr:hypothetical protein [Nocardia macrotermitis]MQY18526.1 hypothetical protein [Nocardia macrotermitis]